MVKLSNPLKSWCPILPKCLIHPNHKILNSLKASYLDRFPLFWKRITNTVKCPWNKKKEPNQWDHDTCNPSKCNWTKWALEIRTKACCSPLSTTWARNSTNPSTPLTCAREDENRPRVKYPDLVPTNCLRKDSRNRLKGRPKSLCRRWNLPKRCTGHLRRRNVDYFEKRTTIASNMNNLSKRRGVYRAESAI